MSERANRRQESVSASVTESIAVIHLWWALVEVPCGLVTLSHKERTLLELDDQLCYCFHVSKRKVVNFIRINQPLVPSQLSECGGAGTGCGWCVPFLKQCFEADADETAADAGISAAEYAAQRASYIAAGKKR